MEVILNRQVLEALQGLEANVKVEGVSVILAIPFGGDYAKASFLFETLLAHAVTKKVA